MKYLILLALVGMLLPACRQANTNADVVNKIADLEYRVSLLEKQLAEKQVVLGKNGKPDAANSYGSSSSTLKPEGKYNGSTSSYYSARCQAITKKGTQCKRSARSGGYCWQHGG
jgi:hypothetical protein